MDNELQKFVNFGKLLKKFNSIKRDLGSIHSDGHFDNDIEHSYRVAMLSWFIILEYKLKLDVDKVIKYALVHDFVEVFTGDLSIYKDYNQATKEKNEHKSLLKLKKDYPKQKHVWNIINEYEKRSDDESRFVYVVEKLEPIIVVLLSEKDHWIKRNVSMEDFIDRKQRKIKDIKTFAQIFNKEMMDYLIKNKRKFFVKKGR